MRNKPFNPAREGERPSAEAWNYVQSILSNQTDVTGPGIEQGTDGVHQSIEDPDFFIARILEVDGSTPPNHGWAERVLEDGEVVTPEFGREGEPDDEPAHCADGGLMAPGAFVRMRRASTGAFEFLRPGNDLRRGVLDEDLEAGSFATMSIWDYVDGDYEDTDEDVEVGSWLLSSGESVPADTHVIAAWMHDCYEVIQAACLVPPPPPPAIPPAPVTPELNYCATGDGTPCGDGETWDLDQYDINGDEYFYESNASGPTECSNASMSIDSVTGAITLAIIIDGFPVVYTGTRDPEGSYAVTLTGDTGSVTLAEGVCP